MGSEGTTSPNGCAAACAVCGGAATVYCAADAAVLCVPCDAAVHAVNPLASRHERVPLAAAVTAEAANSGVYDLFAADDDGGSAATSWPTPAQGQGSPNNSSSSFTSDSGAERSLFDLLSDVDLMVCGGGAGANLSDGVAPHGAGSLWLQPGLPAVAAAWSSWSPPEAIVVPSAAAAAVAAAAEREARVRRYREKRKNRRFQKTIRYASRKAYAEARPRIKGRFVKRAATAAASNDDSTGATDAAEAVKFWLSSSDSPDDNVGFYVDAAATESFQASRKFQKPREESRTWRPW